MVFVGVDISGFSPEARAYLFARVQYIDEYVWYVSLSGEETEYGDHFIIVRGEKDEIIATLRETTQECDGAHYPETYSVDPDEKEKYRTFSVRERFEAAYPE